MDAIKAQPKHLANGSNQSDEVTIIRMVVLECRNLMILNKLNPECSLPLGVGVDLARLASHPFA